MATGDTAEGGDQSVVEALQDAANVLVLSDGMDSEARASYYDTLLPEVPTDLRVLAVEYTRGPDGWLEEWRRHVGELPAETSIVSVDDGVRSAAVPAADPSVVEPDATGTAVTTVASPDDLTGLGITVGNHLRRWDEQPGPALLTLDSLTVLLQFVDLKRVFRFLHVIAGRVRAAGGIGHYHMDPAAHDEQTVATLSSVFDAVARYEAGEWRVTSR
jgi:hypothetical protein